MKSAIVACAIAIITGGLIINSDSVEPPSTYKIGGVYGVEHMDVGSNNRIVLGDSRYQLDLQRDLNRRNQREVLARSGRAGSSETREEGLKICEETWSKTDCGYLDFIFEHESDWVVGRWNTEGCAGLGQACPASKLGESQGSLEGEVKFFQEYATQRYGNAQNAYNFWVSHRWW